MLIAFEKYQGTGNDFVIIDIRNHAIPTTPDIISRLCDRHWGIGADGLILLDKSADHDFSMRYFNADGKESSMCGNGGRCITAFAHKHGIIAKHAFFTAVDGEHRAEILSHHNNHYHIQLQMQDVDIENWKDDEIFLQTGSPHLVKICTGLADKNVFNDGKRLRYDSRYGEGGTNVNFIEDIDGLLNIRTYERGVEDETLSCGTGVTAAAIAWAIRQGLDDQIELQTKGGLLKVSFIKETEKFSHVLLTGAAEFVFSGEIEI
jgi:diaminopimelate epimerase